MKREKKLITNSALVFLGGLGKSAAAAVSILVGSFYIHPSDMGIYDLILSTFNLLQPVIIFQIQDGVYRWLLESPEHRNSIVENGFFIAYRNLLIANMLIVPLMMYFQMSNWLMAVVLLNVNCIYPLMQQVTRGLKNHLIFAASGILNALFVSSMSYVCMRYFRMGVKSLYLSQIAANFIAILYLAWKQKIFLLPRCSPRKREYVRPMLKYSIMLVPNSVNQWIMKALDKYCILLFLSPFENGIYTVAHRFPDVFMTFNGMFYASWVEQSIVEYKSNDRDAYFSKIYNAYVCLFFCAILLAVPATKYLIRFLVGMEYQEAWRYTPLLYLSVAFSGMSSFLATGYLSAKRTEGIMWTSLCGSVVNTLINVLLMPRWGLQIAGFSSVCAYFSMWAVRVWQTRKFFKISIQWPIFCLLLLCAAAFSALVQLGNGWLDLALEVLAVFITLVLHWSWIMFLFQWLKRHRAPAQE